MPAPTELGVFTGPHWMRDLATAVRRHNICTTFGCTTCGAVPLRTALVLSAEKASGSTTSSARESVAAINARLTQDDVLQHLVSQVTSLGPSSADLIGFVVLTLLYSGKQPFTSRLEALLGDSYAGTVLRQIKMRDEEARERRRKHAAFNDPAAVEERKRLRAEEIRRRASLRASRKRKIDGARRPNERFASIKHVKHRQVVFIPKDFEFRGNSVLIRKEGDDLIFSPGPEF